ncbi:hypothetical protein C7974DRAFT_74404 [Boeremia exigua]|uniref:uncharacterized protein n=1 Tax=Boeremia exigua TaxID=749465 RepID=UPI001E8EEC68|nr:uncharacterized protein C7974DRAFT_74404 [Boeremia exigua]KAH6614342.1 hypothetical protein C7974DRAFT_74404 [Boeremia exigua]
MFHQLCADAPPTELAPDPDISGIGVTVAYTSTAALALLLVIADYIFVYHPDTASAADREGIKHDHPSKVNPIDEYLLYWRLGTNREIRGIERWGEKGLRVKNAATHAILTMSDFQLVTGLSILISGFTQLDSGISAYHWQRLVQLAWFSSVTHLCTLTALRNYFRRNTLGYFWRLPGMVILIMMLIVALVPTGHYTWESVTIRWAQRDSVTIRPKPTDPAVCYFNRHEGGCENEYAELCEEVFQASQQRMILSAAFLGVGMCNRLWHLFRLPVRLYNSSRSVSSDMCKTVLSHMHKWTTSWTLWGSIPFGIFVYHPCLALFLALRLLADIITSRAFEVWWLIVSFCWGSLNLWMRSTLNEGGRDTWTFGQVMALLVVFAPVITLIEGYAKATTQSLTPNRMLDTVNTIEFLTLDSRAPSSLVSLISKPVPNNDDFVNPHPAHDYYHERFSFPILVYSTLCSVVIVSFLLLVALRTQDIRPSDIVSSYATSFRFFLVPPVHVILGFLGMCVLLSLYCEIERPRGKAYRYWCRTLQFGLFVGVLIVPSFSYTLVYYLAMICALFWLILSGVHAFRRYKHKRRKELLATGA